MYIGTSLGGCLKSLLANEVSEDDVLLIITRTRADGYDKYINVIEKYYQEGNTYSRSPSRYNLSDFKHDDVLTLASRLWYSGKIHQPRVGISDSGVDNGDYIHTELMGNLWLEIIPPQKMQNPAVKDLWDKVKMTVALTDENY